MKIILLTILFLSLSFAQQKPAKMRFNDPISVDYKFMIWSSYVIDSTYWMIHLPNGDLPRRSNGTYLYWKADSLGNLIPIRHIEIRLPIFMDQSVIEVNQKSFFNSEQE